MLANVRGIQRLGCEASRVEGLLLLWEVVMIVRILIYTLEFPDQFFKKILKKVNKITNKKIQIKNTFVYSITNTKYKNTFVYNNVFLT